MRHNSFFLIGRIKVFKCYGLLLKLKILITLIDLCLLNFYLNKQTNNMAVNDTDLKYNKLGKNFYYHYYSEAECHLLYAKILRKKFQSLETLKIMEIGAGHGNNLVYFKYLGFSWENMYANEILNERVDALKKSIPFATIAHGDAASLDYKENFNIVLQSTVLTSILDVDHKKEMAAKMFQMTKKGGIILWYDFIYDNPRNKNVNGIRRKEIRQLFQEAERIEYYNVTLFPPLGRLIGKLYPLFNLFLFPLRTHVIAVIHK